MELIKAAKNGRLKFVKMLIEKRKIDVNVKFDADSAAKKEIETPIHMAAKFGHLEVVEYLIDQGAHVNGIPLKEHEKKPKTSTPLWSSVCQGRLDVTIYLLKKGATCLSIRSLLYAATFSNNAEMINYILDQNLDINQGSEESPLSFALNNGWKNSMRCLLDRGADYRKRGDKTGTFLVIASFGSVDKSLGCTKMLLDHIEAKEGRAATADYLNDNDNSTGKTALHVAREAKCHDVSRLLLSYGANPNIVDNNGKKPHDCIVNYTIEELRDLVDDLIENGCTGLNDYNCE